MLVTRSLLEPSVPTPSSVSHHLLLSPFLLNQMSSVLFLPGREIDAISSQAGETWPGQDIGRLGTGGQGDTGWEEG